MESEIATKCSFWGTLPLHCVAQTLRLLSETVNFGPYVYLGLSHAFKDTVRSDCSGKYGPDRGPNWTVVRSNHEQSCIIP